MSSLPQLRCLIDGQSSSQCSSHSRLIDSLPYTWFVDQVQQHVLRGHNVDDRRDIEVSLHLEQPAWSRGWRRSCALVARRHRRRGKLLRSGVDRSLHGGQVRSRKTANVSAPSTFNLLEVHTASKLQAPVTMLLTRCNESFLLSRGASRQRLHATPKTTFRNPWYFIWGKDSAILEVQAEPQYTSHGSS